MYISKYLIKYYTYINLIYNFFKSIDKINFKQNSIQLYAVNFI